MRDKERYEFDRSGYLRIAGILSPDETRSLAAAVDGLEATAAPLAAVPPRKVSVWGPEYHHDAGRGIYVHGGTARGQTLMIEDFWNAGPVRLPRGPPTDDGVHPRSSTSPVASSRWSGCSPRAFRKRLLHVV